MVVLCFMVGGQVMKACLTKRLDSRKNEYILKYFAKYKKQIEATFHGFLSYLYKFRNGISFGRKELEDKS